MSEKTFNDVKITSSFTMPETREKLVSGETIGQHFGKIAKVIDDLENGKIVTPEEYTETGNPVVMDGLQSDVPFPKITVSGDIVGKELTLTACGKNLIPFPYNRSSGTYNGLTIDVATDGKFSINGTASANLTAFEFATQSKPIKLVSGASYTINCSQAYNANSFNMFFRVYHSDGTATGIMSYPKTFVATDGDYLTGSLWIKSDSVVSANNVTVQLEVGNTATEYSMYNSAEYNFTPNSNPYVIPNDVRQLSGTNTLYIIGTNIQLSVVGIYKNSATEKIWEELNKKANLTHTHTKSQITDFPTSLPADGGDADTISGYSSGKLFKYLGSKGTSDNCNESIDCGYFLFNGCGGNAPTDTGTVSSGTYFILENEPFNTSYIKQIATFIHGSATYLGKTYIRYCNGTWSKWAEFSTAEDNYWLYTYAADGSQSGAKDRIKAVYNVKNDNRFYLQTENDGEVRVAMADDASGVQGYSATDIIKAASASNGYVSGTVSVPSQSETTATITLGFKPSCIIASSSSGSSSSSNTKYQTTIIIVDDNEQTLYDVAGYNARIAKTSTGFTANFGLVSTSSRLSKFFYIAFK